MTEQSNPASPVARSPAAGVPTLALMRAAFRTTVTYGPDKLYEMRFKFASLADLYGAEQEWLASLAAGAVRLTDARRLSYELQGVLADVKQGCGFDAVCRQTVERVARELAASPVAPAGAPTLTDEQIKAAWHTAIERTSGRTGVPTAYVSTDCDFNIVLRQEFARALLSAGAPVQRLDSGEQTAHSVHEAAPQSSPSAPLPSSRAIDRSELPRGVEQDAARYRWLTAHAFVGECITESGVILEVYNADRRVPIGGSVDAAIDAAMEEQK